jgi:uncharacterized zinc-type alcohol dehydrogenase-like protein
MAAAAGHFDLMIDTVPNEHDVNPYIATVKRDGDYVIVGQLTPLVPPLNPSPLMGNRKSVSGSMIGVIAETQEMLDFCSEHGIVADVEIIPIQKVNEAYERMLKSDVRYRFVIDMASLKSS